MTNNRQEEFKNKLFALLREYNVEMEVEMEGDYYNTVVGINFFAPTVLDKDCNEIHACINFTTKPCCDGT